MKKKYFIFILLTSFNAFSQNDFFVNKKGEKTIIQDDMFDVIIVDKRLQYSEIGKKWVKFIKFSDLDYANLGSFYLKSFSLINKKGKKEKEFAYFVMLETNGKKLLCFPYSIISRGTHGSSVINVFKLNIIDDNNNILEQSDLTDIAKNKNDIEARKNFSSSIKDNFSSCDSFIKEFQKFDLNDEKKISVLGFFMNPIIYKCN